MQARLRVLCWALPFTLAEACARDAPQVDGDLRLAAAIDSRPGPVRFGLFAPISRPDDTRCSSDTAPDLVGTIETSPATEAERAFFDLPAPAITGSIELPLSPRERVVPLAWIDEDGDGDRDRDEACDFFHLSSSPFFDGRDVTIVEIDESEILAFQEGSEVMDTTDWLRQDDVDRRGWKAHLLR